jgi:crossover junction endodeoxyribonuclease RuvC
VLIIGLDPSLTCTGWGIVAKQGNRLSHVANGQVRTDHKAALAQRLVTLDRELAAVIEQYRPDTSAVE